MRSWYALVVILGCACSDSVDQGGQREKCAAKQAPVTKAEVVTRTESKAVALTSPAVVTAATASASTLCRKGKAVRSVLVTDGPENCRVYLVRDGGEPQEVGKAVYERHICGEVRDRIVQNLEEVGFVCG